MREHITGGDVVVVTEQIDGHRIQINPDYIDLLRGQGYEKGTTKLFIQLVKEGMTVVDIGANIGYYTLLAARRVGPHGRVYAFEPGPQDFKLLTGNLRLNGYNNVVAIQKAVSNKTGTAPLFLSPRGSTAHSLLSSRDNSKETIAIETVALDGFFDREGCPAIQVIKMDIEGWEMEALDGMRRTIMRNSPLKMIMEFIPWLLLSRGMRPLALTEKLMELGFTISIIDEETGQTTPLAEYHSGQPAEFITKHKSAVNLLCQK
ncbi:MAG: FkbM family methyltransferase [Dehalococcoidia bacterium]|nr:FkbM family methyltransferase [Dehalococcoidia bacterium]